LFLLSGETAVPCPTEYKLVGFCTAAFSLSSRQTEGFPHNLPIHVIAIAWPCVTLWRTLTSLDSSAAEPIFRAERMIRVPTNCARA